MSPLDDDVLFTGESDDAEALALSFDVDDSDVDVDDSDDSDDEPDVDDSDDELSAVVRVDERFVELRLSVL